MRVEQRQVRVDGLRVHVVHEGLVHEHHNTLGQRSEQCVELVGRDELAGRVVGVAEDDDAGALVDRALDRLAAEAGTGTAWPWQRRAMTG